MAEKKSIVFPVDAAHRLRTKKSILAKRLCRLIQRELTPFDPYFAEYQSDLEGLSKNILSALDRAIGMVARNAPQEERSHRIPVINILGLRFGSNKKSP